MKYILKYVGRSCDHFKCYPTFELIRRTYFKILHNLGWVINCLFNIFLCCWKDLWFQFVVCMYMFLSIFPKYGWICIEISVLLKFTTKCLLLKMVEKYYLKSFKSEIHNSSDALHSWQRNIVLLFRHKSLSFRYKKIVILSHSLLWNQHIISRN